MSKIERVGNLVLLEQKMNVRCKNLEPVDKVRLADGYAQSRYNCVKDLAARILDAGYWTFSDIRNRTREICEFSQQHWSI